MTLRTLRRASAPSRTARRLPTLLSVVVLVLAILPACLPLGRDSGSGWDLDDRGEERFTLRVENHNFLDARIYARWNGDRRRLGTVNGNQNRDFRLGWDGRPLRVEVDFVAGGGFVSQGITVNPGDVIHFRIPASAR